ncbi:MAG: hypothetical protein OEY89_09550 [Gammaproteobacteria bacterium]|nr:hypothetical protein [Gammaproteobacteria bacterium]
MTFSFLKELARYTAILVVIFNVLSAQAAEYDQIKLDLLLANRGDSGAQFYVAGAYEEGRGVPKDLKTAFEWYSKAANNKHNGAQYKLGEFYYNGWGVTRDIDKANYWFKEAEKNGNQLAKIRIAELDSNVQAEKNKLEKQKADLLKEEQRKKKIAEDEANKIKEQELADIRAKRENDERLRKQKTQQAKQIQLAKIQKAAVLPDKMSPVVTKSPEPATSERKISVSEMINSILIGQWRDQSGAASILPSSINSCLKSSDKEIICFSTEQKRVIANSELTFITKSVLTDFNSTGQFRINYYYNVTEIVATADRGGDADPSGLRTEKGWQEPQQVMNCIYLSKAKLECVNGKYKFDFRI